MTKMMLVLLVVVLLLTACAPAGTPAAAIAVDQAWGRTSPMAATAGAFYMKIQNTGAAADRLLGAQSPACGVIELHESFAMDNGAMGMRPVTGGFIEVAAGGQVELKPGGLHLMCMQKKADFKAGDRYDVTLMFDKTGAVETTVEIRVN